MGKQSFKRREVVLALSTLLLAPKAFSQASVASYPDPSKPVRVVNPWTPGGPADTVGRPVVDVLAKAWKQPVILDHRPGANAVIGSDIVAKAPPDGYTLLLGQTSPNVIAPNVGKGTPYDAIKDFVPITQITSAGLVLAVRADLPINSVKDLIAYGKSKPEALTYGSVGSGSTTHLAGEMLKSMGGFQMLHIPYKGAAPVLTDLLGGRISMTFLNIAGVLPHVGAGKLRPIAVTSAKRSSALPDVPTIAETIPGFEMISWYALLAPAGTPATIIDKIYKTVSEGLRQPEVAAQYRAAGQELELSTPQQFDKTIRTEIARYAKLVKDNNITIE